MNEQVKKGASIKNIYIHKLHISTGKTTFDYQKLHRIGIETSQIITNTNRKNYEHLSKDLKDPLTNPKA